MSTPALDINSLENPLERCVLHVLKMYLAEDVVGIDVNELAVRAAEATPFVNPCLKFIPIRSRINYDRGLIGHVEVTIPHKPVHSIQIQTWAFSNDTRLLRARRKAKQLPILDSSKLIAKV